MRPLRFVALSEDGQALVLTDEAGRMLFLTLDESVTSAVQHDRRLAEKLAFEVDASLTPRDIQARIRAGDSVAEVARVANVPVEKVLRFAGPVLQERAAIVQFSQRTCKATNGEIFGELADTRLTEHGIDPQSVSWDAYRRENGTWRIRASWKSGKATARATWDLDKAELRVKAVDDMAHFLIEPPAAEEEEIDPPGFNRPHIAASRTFTDDHEYEQKSSPAVPAISVLQRTPPAVGEKTVASAGRSRPSPSVAPRSAVAALGFGPTSTRKPAKSALPTWDDILFGSRED